MIEWWNKIINIQLLNLYFNCLFILKQLQDINSSVTVKIKELMPAYILSYAEKGQ